MVIFIINYHMQKGVIYKITNKINSKVYIGCTTKTIEERYSSHIHRCYKQKYRCKLYNSIRKYGKENFKIELLQECAIKDMYELEKKYIAQYDSYKKGLNSTLGGEGFLGYTHSLTERKKIVKAIKEGGKSHKNKTYEEIYGDDALLEKQKRSDGVKKSWDRVSEEEKQSRISNMQKSLVGLLVGDKNPMRKKEHAVKVTGYKNGRASSVCQYDKDNNFIAEYETVKSAFLHTGVNNISAACRGLINHAGGYIWKYKSK